MMKSAPSYASAAEEMTIFMTWGMVNLGPFQHRTNSFSDGEMWTPARLCPLDLLWNPASECAAITALLVLYTIPSLG